MATTEYIGQNAAESGAVNSADRNSALETSSNGCDPRRARYDDRLPTPESETCLGRVPPLDAVIYNRVHAVLSGIVCFVRLLRQHLLDLFVAYVDLVYGVAALLKWHIVVITERRKEDFGVPDEALARREIGDLVVPRMSTVPRCLREKRRLTSRMGPSGSSPILMVVHSCLEKAEPTREFMSARMHHPTPGREVADSIDSAAEHVTASVCDPPQMALRVSALACLGSSSRTTATTQTRRRPPPGGAAQG